MAGTSTSVRSSPVTREASVPSAITLLERTRLWAPAALARCAPGARCRPAPLAWADARRELSWESAPVQVCPLSGAGELIDSPLQDGGRPNSARIGHQRRYRLGPSWRANPAYLLAL